MKLSIAMVVALVGALGVMLSPLWAQQDRLIVVCENPYPESSTVHIPVYARLNAPGSVGLTSFQCVFYNDHPGLLITSVEWCGSYMGEESTAIETHIGYPITWAMGNAGLTWRGGTASFTFSDDPSIPSGHHLLSWLVVETGDAGSYLLEPRDRIGDPALPIPSPIFKSCHTRRYEAVRWR